MQDKLNGGDAFPTLALTLVDGGTLALPAEPAASYRIVLFYRGSF